MFCRKCGEKIPEESKFCRKCGEKISSSKMEQLTNNSSAEIIADNINNEVYYENNSKNKKKSNAGMYAVIASIAIVVAVIAGVAGHMLTNNGKTDSDNKTAAAQSSADSSEKNDIIKNESSDTNNVSDDAKTAKNSVPKNTSKNDEYVTKHQEINHTYKVIKMNVTWDEAEAYCEKQGGHLATITSAEEAAKITSLINATDAKVIWLGANDLNSDDQYKWITGEDFTYSNWAPGEPNNDGGIEHYLVVYKVNGEWVWNDGPVDTNKSYDPSYIGFVCEWDE